jgi:hypothetical protein
LDRRRGELKMEVKEYHICKYCREFIKRGKVWNKDAFGNGYHHECYLKLQKYFSYLPQSDILGDD